MFWSACIVKIIALAYTHFNFSRDLLFIEMFEVDGIIQVIDISILTVTPLCRFVQVAHVNADIRYQKRLLLHCLLRVFYFQFEFDNKSYNNCTSS